MQIGDVLTRAFEIIRKHKVLWLFGILAGCANSNSSGSSGLNYRFSYRDVPDTWSYNFEQPFERIFGQVDPTMVYVWIGLAILLILGLVVVSIFLGTMGRVGLVRGTQQAENGAERLEFGELFRGGMPYFWRVFGLSLLVGLAAFVVVGALLIAGTLGTILTLGLGFLCLAPLICLLVPTAIALDVVVRQANIAIITEDLDIMSGLRRGWAICRDNPGNIIVMALILGIANAVTSFLVTLPLVAVAVPALIGVISENPQMIGGSLLFSALCFIGYLPVLIGLNGIVSSYIETAWTLTFLRLGRPAASA